MRLEISKMDATIAAKFVQAVLNCITQEYPHSNIFWFNSDQDIKPPRKMTPVFYGCLDWHSAVHGHWLLIRLSRCLPDAAFQETARHALSQSFTSEKIQGEIAHLEHCPFFECPYGFAWLLQLAMELRDWNDRQAKGWLAVLEPLETLVAHHFHRWLQKLEFADRTGTHFHTAFPLSLALDWARVTKHTDFANTIKNKAQKFYLNDQNYPLHIEPLAYDFVSPGLAEADLMRRVLSPTLFAEWLTQFLPQLPAEKAIFCAPIILTNSQSYLQSHFQGLNLSRAWMIEGIMHGLPDGDSRLETLRATAIVHRQAGLVDTASDHYSSSHWLGTFATYLVTSRGLQL